jgi:hypothetical protein
MDRRIDDRNILDKFTEEFCSVVNGHVSYMIVSGFAAISSGRTRGTEDIDMIIAEIPKEKFIDLHKDLVKNNFECMQSSDPETIYEQYLKAKVSIRYTWKGKYLPEMEIHFACDPLDEYQLNRRAKYELTGLDVYFAPLEGNIAIKEDWLKGDKDIEDARHLRIVYSEIINEDEINKIKEMIRRYKNER